MNRTMKEKFDLREEFRLIPTAMTVVAALAFVGIQVLILGVVFPRDHHAPPLFVQGLIAFLAGSVLACIILLVGYVNRDAKRRGMNHVLWTVLVLVIPHAIGFIIYFVIRQPVRVACPHCGALVNAAFNYCPNCKFNLRPSCPKCHSSIAPGDAFCAYCAAELKEKAS